MPFQPPSLEYNISDQAQFRHEAARLDAENLKRQRDIEIGDRSGVSRLIVTDTVTGTRYKITVVSGALTLTAV